MASAMVQDAHEPCTARDGYSHDQVPLGAAGCRCHVALNAGQAQRAHPEVRGLGAGGAVPQRRQALPQRHRLLGRRHAAAVTAALLPRGEGAGSTCSGGGGGGQLAGRRMANLGCGNDAGAAAGPGRCAGGAGRAVKGCMAAADPQRLPRAIAHCCCANDQRMAGRGAARVRSKASGRAARGDRGQGRARSELDECLAGGGERLHFIQ